MPNYTPTDPEYWEGATYALPGVKSKRWQIGTTSPDDAFATALEMDPGFVIARHAHNYDRFEVIVKGTLYIGDRVYGPGDVMTAHAHEFYGPKVAGPDGCTTMEFFAQRREGDYLRFELADGSTIAWTHGMDFPENPAEEDWIAQTRAKVLAAVPAPAG